MRRPVVLILMVLVAGLLAVQQGANADVYPPGEGVIEGRVTMWGTGEPVEGVEVRGYHTGWWYVTYTDADGNYRLEDLEADDYRIAFYLPGTTGHPVYYPGSYDDSDAAVLTITGDEVYTGIDGAVQDGGTLVGRVTDDITGDPIAGICAEAYRRDELAGSSVSNDGGWFLFPDVTVVWEDALSDVLLYDCNDLGYTDEGYGDVPIAVGGSASVLEWDSTTARFDAHMGPEAAIAGTVTDLAGSPLEGICVSLTWGPNHFPMGDMTTGSSGYFEFTGLTASDYYDLGFVDCNIPIGRRTALGVDAPAVSGTTTYYEQVLEPIASITGTVTDATTGVPLEGICVRGSIGERTDTEFASTHTDADGVYSLPASTDWATEYVRAFSCTGSAPLYHQLWWDGAVEFEDATDLQLGPLEQRTGVDLALPRMASLQGTLVGADGLAAEAHIDLEPLFDDPAWWPDGYSNPDGTYRIDGIDPGSYRISFGSDLPTSLYPLEWYDNAVSEQGATIVTFGWDEVITIDAELSQVGVLEWDFLRYAPGDPSACVYLTDTGGRIARELSDDEDHHFMISAIPAGEYLLFVEGCDIADPGFAPSWYPNGVTRTEAELLSVENDHTDLGDWVIDPEIPPAATISGEIRVVGGDPIDACVTVLDESMMPIAAAEAIGGTYQVDGLVLRGPEAALYVMAEDCDDPTVSGWYGGATQHDAVGIPFGLGLDLTGIDVELPAGPPPPEAFELSVRVTSPLGAAVAGVCVDVAGDQGSQGVTGADGSISFDLRAGDYSVTAGSERPGCVDGYEPVFVDVTIAEDTDLVVVLPLAADFTDIGDSVFADDIEWLGGAGVTLGCNPPLNTEYCPDQVVTRGQMAAFLVRALGLTDRLDDPFTDDDVSVFEADIEKLAAAGITKGCNPPVNDMFCPEAPVTRAQMAAFLVRALSYTDSGDGDLFTDDDGSLFEDAIDKLATGGVTRGCNPPTNDMFCPNDVVTRGQMAAFLHRAVG